MYKNCNFFTITSLSYRALIFIYNMLAVMHGIAWFVCI